MELRQTERPTHIQNCALYIKFFFTQIFLSRLYSILLFSWVRLHLVAQTRSEAVRLGEISYSDVMVVGYIYENALKVLFS